MKIVKISAKNQITIPVSILSSLDMSAQGKAYIEADRDKIIIKPIKGSVTESVAGSLTHLVPKDKLNKPLAEIEKVTKIEVAKHLAAK